MIPLELRPLIGNRIYGCDDCLAVCPWNKFARAATGPDFLPRAELTAPRLAELAALDDAAFRAMFGRSPIKRTGRRPVCPQCADRDRQRDPGGAGVVSHGTAQPRRPFPARSRHCGLGIQSAGAGPMRGRARRAAGSGGRSSGARRVGAGRPRRRGAPLANGLSTCLRDNDARGPSQRSAGIAPGPYHICYGSF